MIRNSQYNDMEASAYCCCECASGAIYTRSRNYAIAEKCMDLYLKLQDLDKQFQEYTEGMLMKEAEKTGEAILECRTELAKMWMDDTLMYSDEEMENVRRTGYPDTEKDSWEDIIHHPDAEVQMLGMDVRSLDEDLATQRKMTARMDAKVTESIENVLDAVEYAEEAVHTGSMLQIPELTRQTVLDKEGLSEKEIQTAKEILELLGKTYTASPNLGQMKETKDTEMLFSAQKEMVAHPINFMIGQIKEAIDTYREAKAAVKLAEQKYTEEKESVRMIAAEAISPTYIPLKSSILSSARESLSDSARTLGTALEELATIGNKVLDFCKSAGKGLVYLADMAMETVTLGNWSNFCMQVNEKAADYMNRKYGMELQTDSRVREAKRFHGIVEHSIDAISKDLGLRTNSEIRAEQEKYFDSVFEKIGYIGLKAQQLFQKPITLDIVGEKGNYHVTASKEYYTGLKAAVWKGKTSPADKVNSIVQSFRKDMKNYEADRDEAFAFADKALTEWIKAIPDALTSAGDIFGKAVKEARKDFDVVVLAVEQAGYAIASKTISLMADGIDRQERRALAKTRKMMEVDASIFESLENIRKEIHSLTSPVRYEKQPYVPNPELVKINNWYREMTPTPTIDFIIRQNEKLLKKEEKQHDKAEAKAEKESDRLISRFKKNKDAMIVEQADLRTKFHESGDRLLDAQMHLLDIKAKRESYGGMGIALAQKIQETDRKMNAILTKPQETKTEETERDDI